MIRDRSRQDLLADARFRVDQANTFLVMQGAEEMGQMEHLLNVYASKAAKSSIADFLGYIEVAEEQATTKLTQGVWLVSNTSASRSKHCSEPQDLHHG